MFSLFFALLPDAQTVRAVSALGPRLCAAHGLKGRPIWPDRLHVTLVPVPLGGGALPDAVAAAKDAAERVRTEPVDVAFDIVQGVPARGRYPFVLAASARLEGIAALRRSLVQELARAGFFVGGLAPPHMTLVWADRIVKPQPIAPIRWTAREFVLVLSLIGRATHRHLGSWELKPWRRPSPSTASRTATR